MVNNDMTNDVLCAGVDEVARGCLFGRVYAAVVIWRDSSDLDKLLNILRIKNIKLKDSKKLSRKDREFLRYYIENFALDYSVDWCDSGEVDSLNISNATFKSMHKALDKLTIIPEMILVDGNRFKKYKNIEHECIIKGDGKITSISAASILAKVYHDQYIIDLIEKHPELKKYDLLSNMGYGTKKHLDAIKKYGITKYHRKTFGICKG
jgi:ribonuclease HII